MPFNTTKKSVSATLGEVNVRVLNQDEHKNYRVEIEIMRSGWVQSDTWKFMDIEKHSKGFAMQPILIAYLPQMGSDGIGDGHNANERVDPQTGQKYRSFTGSTAQRSVGYVTDDIRVEKRDGEDWVIAKGVIWEHYNKELVEKLRRTGRMSVSAETLVDDIEEVPQGEIFHTWTALGVTILGDHVAPAVPNANIQALRAAAKEVEKIRVAQQNNSKGDVTRMSKKILREMAEKFTNHTVVGMSSDSNTVFLLSNAHEMLSYTFTSDDKGEIDEKRLMEVSLSLSAKCGDMEHSVDWRDVVKALSEQNEELTKRCETAEAKATEMEAKATEMEAEATEMAEKELARNREDYVLAAKARLAEINKHRECDDEVPDEEIEEEVEAAKTMEFEKDCDVKEMAKKAVDAKAMSYQLKLDEKKAETRSLAKENRMSFEKILENHKNNNTVDSAMARLKARATKGE